MPAEWQELSATPVCEEAAEADAHKAARQGVEQEPPQEFLASYSHQPLLALVGIVFPSEGDLTVGEVYDPVVGDGDAMCIARQVMEDMFRPSEGSLGVDHPVLTEQRAQKSMESFLFAESPEASGKPQFAVAK